jgi:hypothetical protein
LYSFKITTIAVVYNGICEVKTENEVWDAISKYLKYATGRKGGGGCNDIQDLYNFQ